jgi:hypothetical protein
VIKISKQDCTSLENFDEQDRNSFLDIKLRISKQNLLYASGIALLTGKDIHAYLEQIISHEIKRVTNDINPFILNPD